MKVILSKKEMFSSLFGGCHVWKRFQVQTKLLWDEIDFGLLTDTKKQRSFFNFMTTSPPSHLVMRICVLLVSTRSVLKILKIPSATCLTWMVRDIHKCKANSWLVSLHPAILHVVYWYYLVLTQQYAFLGLSKLVRNKIRFDAEYCNVKRGNRNLTRRVDILAFILVESQLWFLSI